MSTIPASQIVTVIPGVLSAGGNALDLNGLFLTDSTRPPMNTVLEFTSAEAVADYFGSTSEEADRASNYFLGFDGKTQVPGKLLVAQYNQNAVAAYIRGGNVGAALTLTGIKALSGSLTATIDGYDRVASSIDLSSSTSYSAAAALIQAGLNASPSTLADFTGEVSGKTLTVTAVSSGTLAVGQHIVSSSIAAGTIIEALGTGEGLTGTYTVNNAQTVASEAMTTEPVDCDVSYDSQAGAFVIASGITGAASLAGYCTGTLAASLLLTSATGAVLSQGAAAAVPATFMDALIDLTQNWACFTTLFNPDTVGDNTVKLEFAAWTNGKANRYAYVPWDSDTAPLASSSVSSCLPKLVASNTYSGICSVYGSDAEKAAFVLGFAASLDFGATNGRATLKFKGQSGIAADITSEIAANNLSSNGYNYMGAWATANDGWVFMAEGVISGDFQWFDTYVNQIWINNQLQLALMVLLTTVKSIPYNRDGYAQIEAAMLDPIQTAINFGAIRKGVSLSESQKSIINSAAGKPVDEIITRQGFYLQVLDPTPIVRQARGTPPCNVWYCDGESIHRITLNSIVVQ